MLSLCLLSCDLQSSATFILNRSNVKWDSRYWENILTWLLVCLVGQMVRHQEKLGRGLNMAESSGHFVNYITLLLARERIDWGPWWMRQYSLFWWAPPVMLLKKSSYYGLFRNLSDSLWCLRCQSGQYLIAVCHQSLNGSMSFIDLLHFGIK